MDSPASNKRLKSISGAPISNGNGILRGAAALPAYQPPSAAALTPSRIGGRSTAHAARSTASVSRPGDGNKLRLTVKAPPSKLRQAISGSRLSTASDEQSESDATPQPKQRSVRSTRNTRTLVDPDSDEIDDMADEDEAAYESLDRKQNEKPGAIDSELDAEGEEEDEEEDDQEDDEEEEEEEDDDDDERMGDAADTPQPVTPANRRENQGRPNFNAASLAKGPLKSVEDKEMEDADEDDDEELSELDSNDEEESGEGLQRGILPTREEEDDDDDDEDSDEDIDNSRSATPDLSKLTRRQRGAYEEDMDSSLLALSNEAQKKKVFTEEEHAVRRQEMARRRKNLSEKRNEEEKMETINKLLKKPAPKRRTRAEILAAQHAAEMAGTPGAEDGEEEPPHPVFARWVADQHGSRVGIPREWIQGHAGNVLAKMPGDEDTIKVSHRAVPYGGLLVEEIS